MSPKRFGSVRELPSGRFQARYRPRLKPERHVALTFDTRDDAEAYLAAMQALEHARVSGEGVRAAKTAVLDAGMRAISGD